MNSSGTVCPSDALVFFGATGDLVYKKIFPALLKLFKKGKLEIPVIGVAKSGWGRDQLIERAHASLNEYGGGVNGQDFAALVQRLDYVDGDYADNTTVDQVKQKLGDAKRPTHYLAIPPFLFGTAVQQLGRAGLARDGRVIEDFGIKGRGKFYDATGAIRDVLENHLFQIVSLLAMKLPARMDADSLHDERSMACDLLRESLKLDRSATKDGGLRTT